MPEEPMDVDAEECPGYRYVIVYLDGRHQCFDGDPDLSGLTSWRQDGRYLIETRIGAAPRADNDTE